MSAHPASRTVAAGIALLVPGAALAAITVADPADPPSQAIDEAIREAAISSRGTLLTGFAEFLSVIGRWPWSYVAMALVAAALWWRAGPRAGAGVVVATVLTTLVAVPLLKVAVGRDRPLDHLVEVAGFSFPSGHTAVAAALTMSAALAVPRHRRAGIVAAVVVTAVMAWSRVYLSVHWPADTLAAALLGFGLAIIVHAQFATEDAQRRNAPETPPPDHRERG